MPFKVDVEQVKSAIMVADALGRNYKLRKQAK